jgi:hypothetical protein
LESDIITFRDCTKGCTAFCSVFAVFVILTMRAAIATASIFWFIILWKCKRELGKNLEGSRRTDQAAGKPHYIALPQAQAHSLSLMHIWLYSQSASEDDLVSMKTYVYVLGPDLDKSKGPAQS